jgi:hypothetical protein
MDTGTVELLVAPYGQKDGRANPPNPTQKKVLDWVDRIRKLPETERDHIFVLYIQGGVGSGKTRSYIAVAQEMLIEIPGLRALWGRWDLKDLTLSIVDKFFELTPPELLGERSKQYNWYDVKQNGGGHSRIYFNGLKDLTGLGSQEFGLILVNEVHEITENTYRALKRRCRQAGVLNIILMEGEAPNEGHWLQRLTNPADESYDSDIEMWQLSTYENWDNLPTAYRGSLEGMPEAWKRKYLFGKFGFQPDGKPFYLGFYEHSHTGEFEWIHSKPLLLGWDFGFHFPACIITQIDQQDKWIWLREIIGRDVTIDKFADRVLSILNSHYPNAEIIHYGDPAVIQVNDKSELTSWQILQSKGIQLYYRQSTYRDRKEIIEGKLSKLINGKPSLMLDTRYCRTAVEGFLGGYHYPEHKQGVAFADKFEMPFKDGYYEHIMNSGEYISVNVFSPIKIRQGKKEQRTGGSADNI